MLYSGQGYQANYPERGIGMVNLSKSKYCALWQCPKMLWLRKYKPELAEVDSHTLSIMETGKLPRVKSIEVLKEEEV